MTGQTLAHYRILRTLGKGGMGEVYLAEDTTLKRHVALKVLPAPMRDDPDRLARFRAEAEAAARLNHPNIATIYSIETADDPGDAGDGDVGAKHAPHASPLPFITMEYIDGQPLSALIPANGMAVPDGNPVGAKQATHASPLHFLPHSSPLRTHWRMPTNTASPTATLNPATS